MPNPRWTLDRKAAKSHLGIVGVDEAGRGCLAGPVVAGAVILPAAFFVKPANRKATAEMNDSKQFDEARREELYQVVLELGEKGELHWGVGEAGIEEIESENIVGATCLAMKRAIDLASQASRGLWEPQGKTEADLFSSPDQDDSRKSWLVRVDGRPMKRLPYRHQGLVKGDTLSLAVAMASLLAKVTRDRGMRRLAGEFPAYDFGSNKGYGSPKHLTALKAHGPSVHHRPKFLRNLLGGDSRDGSDDAQSRLSFV